MAATYASSAAAAAPGSATSVTVNQGYAVGWSVKRNTGTGDSERAVAASTGESALGVSQNQGALTTYAAFGQGSAGSDTAMGVRDLALNVGAAHSVAQLQANVTALATEYGLS